MFAKNIRWLDWDRLGGALSFLCLIHCLVLPWMAALLPVTLLLDESAHVWLFLALAPAAALAAWSGFRTHRKHLPSTFMATGVLLVGIAAFTPINEALEVALTVAGSLLLITGHIHNRRLKPVHRRVIQAS